MSARRKTDHPDSLWINAPFCGPAADETDSSLRVKLWAKGRLPSNISRTPRHAILEDNARDSHRIQPSHNFLTFELPIQVPVAPSGADHHCRSGVVAFGRLIDRQGRPGHIGNQ